MHVVCSPPTSKMTTSGAPHHRDTAIPNWWLCFVEKEHICISSASRPVRGVRTGDSSPIRLHEPTGRSSQPAISMLGKNKSRCKTELPLVEIPLPITCCRRAAVGGIRWRWWSTHQFSERQPSHEIPLLRCDRVIGASTPTARNACCLVAIGKTQTYFLWISFSLAAPYIVRVISF